MRLVALSFACNNACITCAQGKLRATSGNLSLATSGNLSLATSGNLSLATSGHLSLATSGNQALDSEAAVRRALSEIAAGETVALTGGEPTLDERLPSYVRELHAAGAGRIVVQTNGRRLAYRSYARLLREASDRLVLDVSIAGSTEAMHDYHTGTPGSFKQTVTGLRNARAEGIAASVSCVVTRSNFRHLVEIVRLCHAASAAGMRFVLAQPFGTARALRDRVVPAPELVAPYLALALAEARKLGLAVFVDAGEETGGTIGAPHEGPAGAFAGLGIVEEAEATPTAEAPAPAQPAQPTHRALPMFGRPAPGRREERTPARKTGDDLRAILPALFDGSAPRDVRQSLPRDVAQVVAAAAAEEKGAA